MRKALKVLFCFCFFIESSFAAGLENAPIYKDHPASQGLLSEYWRVFLVGKTQTDSPGKLMASQVRLNDVEDELIMQGFDEQALEVLREQAQAAFVQLQQQNQKVVRNESFFDLIESLRNLNAESYVEFGRDLSRYVEENPSRKEKQKRFLKVLDDSSKNLQGSVRMEFIRMALSFYLLAEAQNFLGLTQEIQTKLGKITSSSMNTFLYGYQISKEKNFWKNDFTTKVVGPTLDVFVASGVPDLTDVAATLLNQVKHLTAEQKSGFIKTLYQSLKAKKQALGAIGFGAGVATAATGTVLTLTFVSHERIGPLLYFASPFIWVAVLYLLSDIFIGRSFLPNRIADAWNQNVVQNKKRKLLKDLSATCSAKLQGTSANP